MKAFVGRSPFPMSWTSTLNFRLTLFGKEGEEEDDGGERRGFHDLYNKYVSQSNLLLHFRGTNKLYLQKHTMVNSLQWQM